MSASKPFLIFGREPVVIAGVVAAVLSALALTPLGAEYLSGNAQVLWNVALMAGFGVASAWSVAGEKLLAALVGLASVVFPLLLEYGVSVPEDTQSTLLSAFAVVVSFFLRTQVVAPAPPTVSLNVHPLGVPDVAEPGAVGNSSGYGVPLS